MSYTLTYDPSFCDQVIELGKKGKTKTQMAAKFGVSRNTIYDWMNKYPDFQEAMDVAVSAAQNWWEKQLQRQTKTGEGSATAAIFAMKNQFPDQYKDRKETHHSGELGVFELDFTGFAEDDDEPGEE